ncbi:MAG: DUF2339 domain-containing protein [Pontiella sp.]
MVFFALIILFPVVFAPLIFSIIALVKVSSLRAEMKHLRDQSVVPHPQEKEAQFRRVAPLVTPPPSVSEPSPVVVPPANAINRPPPPPSVSEPSSVVVPPANVINRPPPPAPKRAPKKSPGGFEFLMGGKAAAFAGIAILVMGIVFLVGYAIQHAWLGPGARVLLGLLFGFVLVGLGFLVHRKDEKYRIFSMVLTGGGSALFYFTVFMSFAFYQLIGPWVAGVGLFICAAAIFGLALFYRAQSVAVLGVLGAFVTPVLVGGNLDAGLFALVYVALINVPVILLGVQRKWQLLYNLAFFFTTIHVLIWMDRIGPGESGPGMLFGVIYFLEFIALALLKLKHEQKIYGRNADFIRILISSVLLLGMFGWVLEDVEHVQWTGLAFLGVGLVHIGIAKMGYTMGSRFSGEIICFLAGGLFAFAMALPVQFDGAWVSGGWAIEGVIVAWVALRVKSRALQAGGLLLGLFGLLKGLIFDVDGYVEAPVLFLNPRFIIGFISIGLLGLQGKIADRASDDDPSSVLMDFIYWIAFLAMLLFAFPDIFWAIGMKNPNSWLLTSVWLAGTGAAILFVAPRSSSVLLFGSFCLLVVPIKMCLLDSWILLNTLSPFANRLLWSQLLLLGVLVGALKPRITKLDGHLLLPAVNMKCLLDLLSISAALGLISLEIGRVEAGWADMGITILWAISALGIILLGMKCRVAAYRYFGLVLFTFATLKVLIVDSSEMEGLERIGAFMVTGVLLLALSFAYQKTSAYFQSLEEDAAKG